jgi:hypothetical protein
MERCEMEEEVLEIIALTIQFDRYELYNFVVGSNFPTPIHVAAAILALDVDEVGGILSELSSIIEVTSDALLVYHASLEDFLCDQSRSNSMCVDKSSITRRIFKFCLQSFHLYCERLRSSYPIF